jgi:uncharacterized protein (DUF983 family)
MDDFTRPVSEICPNCGFASTYVTVKPLAYVTFQDDRRCNDCGACYTPPTPKWGAQLLVIAGLVFLIAGISTIAAMVYCLFFWQDLLKGMGFIIFLHLVLFVIASFYIGIACIKRGLFVLRGGETPTHLEKESPHIRNSG